MTYKEFRALKKEAKESVKTYATNPHQICRQLAAAAQKNEYSSQYAKVKEVAKLLMSYGEKRRPREAFSLDLLEVDSKGRFVRRVKRAAWPTLSDEVSDTDANGREYIPRAEGGVWRLQPISYTPQAFFNAFCAIVEKDLKALRDDEARKEKAAKDAAKASASQLRALKQERKELCRALSRGEAVAAEVIERLELIDARESELKAAAK